MMPPAECPVCGASVPRHARACPNCGADERSGWNEEAAIYDGLDLPEEAGDEEAGGRRSGCGGLFRRHPAVTIAVAILVLIAFGYLFVR